MNYRNVESEFIKSLIRQTSWENNCERERIDDLVRLEKYILEGTRELTMREFTYGSLQAKHHWEWAVIYQELKPEEFKIVKKNQRMEDEELMKQYEKTLKESEGREKRLKQEWLEIGGKE